ncbi:hypothetical protein SPFM9_00170 [Salmonella phage SPFM9]|nr:hypothetical protein SPFM9_00170 [Salmonella phage SPFM9]
MDAPTGEVATAEEWCAYAPHFKALQEKEKRNHTTFTVSEDTDRLCITSFSAISAMGLDVPTFANFKDPKVGWEIKINDAYRRVWCSALGVYAHPSAKSQNYRSLGITPSQVSNYNNYEFAIDRENNVLVWDKEKLEMWQELPEDIRRLVSELMYFQDHAGRVPPLLTPANSLELGDWTLDEYARLKNLYTRKQHHAYAVVGWNKLDALESPLVQQGNVVNGLAKLMCDIAVLGEENFPPVVTAGYANGWVAIVERLMDRHHAQTDHVTWPAYFSMWNGGNANFMEILCSTWIMYQLLCKAPANEARHVRETKVR